ncbi:hypothetical protein KSP39_PZI012212 [Platanthera zijinensis]|uniref:Reverse transcriptase domain-containing protein n=1 Tax=Platanthera zijinensis TaxID=2320716 RepID=A0AAP0G4Q1_9ASPA
MGFRQLTYGFRESRQENFLTGHQNRCRIMDDAASTRENGGERGDLSMLSLCTLRHIPDPTGDENPVQSDSPVEPCEVQPGTTLPTAEQEELDRVLAAFSTVFQEPTELPPHRDHVHRIPLTEGHHDINLRPYRYPPLQKDEIEKLVREMLQAGVIRPSNSPYASPVVLVRKGDGTWRLCIDYRQLNSQTVKDKFPIPIIEELIDELHGGVFFSKLDMRAGYHQVRMAEEDVYKTAFRTHNGHYEFLVMPFGLTNAPSTFQSLMNKIFHDQLRRFVLIFFDDILVFSRSWQEHMEHLTFTLETLRRHSLFIKRSKCSFGRREIHYLGHIISGEGVATDPEKVRAMLEWPTPQTVKQVRGFLGLTGYYRRFIQGYGGIARPLTELLKAGRLVWTAEAELAFQHLKTAVSQPPVLCLPDFTKPFVLESDASNNGIGVVLLQQGRPVEHFSKALGKRNSLLSVYEKELLAVVLAVQHWRHYLLTGPFIIRTDQQSLRFLAGQRLATPAQQKYMAKLLGYDYSIQYKQGKENLCADALSRKEGSEELELCTIVTITSDFLRELQESWQQDPKLRQIIMQKTADNSSYPKYQWERGLLKRKGRLVVGEDAAIKARLLHEYHNSPWGGIRALRPLITDCGSAIFGRR